MQFVRAEYDFIIGLGNRLKAVILRDCNGTQESAMLPFTSVYRGASQTDWMSLIRGLREIGFDGELIMDMRDTAAAFSHLLRPEILRLSKKVADFLKWQIKNIRRESFLVRAICAGII